MFIYEHLKSQRPAQRDSGRRFKSRRPAARVLAIALAGLVAYIMLSPGKYHLDVPRDLVANLRFRKLVYQLCIEDEDFARGIVEVCRQDCLFFMSAVVWCFNPKLPPSMRVQPFIPWDFQEEITNGPKSILWCFEHNRSGVCEKSREMGMSWLFLIVQVWLCLFFDYSQILNISRDADSVDCKSPDSLFWKIRFIHQHLPRWLKGDVTEQKMYFEYASTNATNTGEASTAVAGVGGRATGIFLDEFSKVKVATEVRAFTAGTSDVRFFNGTHEGKHTEFYRITQQPEFIKWVVHWTQHPLKNKGLYSYDRETCQLKFWNYSTKTHQIEESPNLYSHPPGFEFVLDGSPSGGPFPGIRSPWYDWKCKEIGDSRLVAMELDIDPAGSVAQFFDPILIHELLLTAKPPRWEGDIAYDADGKNPRLIEVSGGPLKLWCRFLPDGTPPLRPYNIGADCSGGTGRTPSCLSVTDGVSGEQVGEYVNAKIDPKEFGTLIVAVGTLFCDVSGKPATVAWEHRGPGVTTGVRLIELQYGSLYRPRTHEVIGRPIAVRYGWNPEKGNKDNLLRDLKIAMQRREFTNYSKKGLEECLEFKYDASGKVLHTGESSTDDPSGAKENHGDRVIAAGISWMLTKENGRLSLDSQNSNDEEQPVLWFQTMGGRRAMADKKQREQRRWA